jgi:hypothetical protein
MPLLLRKTPRNENQEKQTPGVSPGAKEVFAGVGD